MSRITLITSFKKQELQKIDRYLKDINFKICKVPYGIDDNNRFEIDNLPYHLTIFATDKENQDELINIIRSIDIKRIILKVNKVEVMNGRNNSFVLYFGIEDNSELKELQNVFYKKFPKEHYNPDNFIFHITIHIDKDYNRIQDLRTKILQTFESFTLEFNHLDLYDYPGEIIDWRDS